MRTYIVIPEGTRIVRVDASTPHFALSKAKHGHGVAVGGELVAVPLSAMVAPKDDLTAVVPPGQMTLMEDVV